MAVLNYGISSCVELELAEGVLLGEVGIPRGQPLDDLAAAMRATLANPIDYPSLARSTTPADHVVVALDRGLPQVAEVTASIVDALIHSGIDPDGITVLRSQADLDAGADNPCRLVPAPLRKRITLLTHNPADRRQLAYLAANPAGEAILVNRALHDADVVLPVGCLRPDETVGYFGIHGGLFPTFSDVKTLQRFRSRAALNGQGARKRELCAEVDNAAWWLGINFTVQLIPAAGGRVLQVVAGQCDAVRQQARELYRAAWSWPAPDRASLVVASIEGDAAQQTWENLGRTLQAAAHFVEADGAIAVCCDLAVGPGPALQSMARASSRDPALGQDRPQRPADALPAAQLARALQQHKVYLLSRLDPSVVEELDVFALAGLDELARLVHQHRSCILLSNAQYVTTRE